MARTAVIGASARSTRARHLPLTVSIFFLTASSTFIWTPLSDYRLSCWSLRDSVLIVWLTHKAPAIHERDSRPARWHTIDAGAWPSPPSPCPSLITAFALLFWLNRNGSPPPGVLPPAI